MKRLSKDIKLRRDQLLDVPLSQIYSVVTFFKVFTLVPQGKHKISVCFGTACHIKGAENIAQSPTTARLPSTSSTDGILGVTPTSNVLISPS